MDKKRKEYGEDASKYREFVSSFFGWVAPEKQKDRANELQKMTKSEEKKRKE